MKIVIVSPVFKTGDTANISNYCPISVLPCFSKILERVMYNRLYKYLADQITWLKIVSLADITPTTVWLPKRPL